MSKIILTFFLMAVGQYQQAKPTALRLILTISSLDVVVKIRKTFFKFYDKNIVEFAPHGMDFNRTC